MRLAQLARKIAVKPSEIASYLTTQGIAIEDSSNAKIADDHVQLVLQHFEPDLMASEVEAEFQQLSVMPETAEEPMSTDNAIEPLEGQSEEINPENSRPEGEVIKPVKVELPGLKVVGKIELPEPKKKIVEEKTEEQLPTTPGQEAESKPPAETREFRKPRRQNRIQETRPRKNPIALQREREEREALRKKLEEQKKEKELKTQRYLKKVSQYTPPVRRAKQKNQEQYEVYKEEKPVPKSLVGKILNWFVSK